MHVKNHQRNILFNDLRLFYLAEEPNEVGYPGKERIWTQQGYASNSYLETFEGPIPHNTSLRLALIRHIV